MFMRFFTELREAKVPVTLKEYLMLMEALDKDVIERKVEDFYFLSRSAARSPKRRARPAPTRS
jgi:uncharacterized protein with von Willebrand factor type A (vWA) domain